VGEEEDGLADSEVETALLDLVLDIAAAGLAHVAHDLGEHPFEGVVAHGATGRAFGVLDSDIAVVADVDGGAVEVAGVLGGIAVEAAQTGDIFLGAQDAGDDELMEGEALDVEAIEEGSAHILQEEGGTGNEIGDALTEGVDMVIGGGSDIDELALTLLGIDTVLHGGDAPAACCRELGGIGIGEAFLEAGNGTYLMEGFVRCGRGD